MSVASKEVVDIQPPGVEQMPGTDAVYAAIAIHRRRIDVIDRFISVLTIPMGWFVRLRERETDKIGDIKAEYNLPVIQPERQGFKEHDMTKNVTPGTPRHSILTNFYNPYGIIMFRSIDDQYRKRREKRPSVW